jgi:SAM-dependent methyltransferase
MRERTTGSAAPTAVGRGPFALVQRVPYLEALCRGKRVLHLGCTNWPYAAGAIESGDLLHLRLKTVAAELHGLDLDPAGLGALQALGVGHLHEGDLERLDDIDLTGPFDVIVAGEVIEHLANPGLMLRGVRRWLGPDSRLVLTTVNAYCAFRFAQYAFRGRGGVREPVHPDHVAYYSYATLTRLVERESLVIDRFHFYDLGIEHRPHLRRSLRWLNDGVMRLWPQLADGIIAECALPNGAQRPTE